MTALNVMVRPADNSAEPEVGLSLCWDMPAASSSLFWRQYLDSERLATALHAGLASTLLVPAPSPLGVAWRHILIGEAIRNLLLPLEIQAIARRAADRLADGATRTDGQLRLAAHLYELAGDRHQAANS